MSSFKITGKARWIKTKGGILVAESPWTENQVMANDGRGVYIFLDRLTNDTTYDGIVTHADLGDDNTAPDAADTDLGNGLVRAQIAAYSRSGLTADFRFFYPDAVTPDDTYEEIGMFTDGTPTLGTGRLFNHLVFSTSLVKATGEDHTVQLRITASVT
ncbi:MAG: hypothetical protein Tp172MES00d2C118482111_10 [Prokaryotic dsDNA virus sp.]|nr:MAG: hypothetical protein Tp172MES00d2C118482111_10 [Prokaryotic dsDNA virus sp.]|tara:strand:- start:8444 stop:8917 length:474 start_codon:yes stop_codon:yes gene_type:complete